MAAPARGDIWLADLNPTRGREQRGHRPVLVISEDIFNQGPAELAIVIPLTSTDRKIPSHVSVIPPEGGLKNTSFFYVKRFGRYPKSDWCVVWAAFLQLLFRS